MTTLLTTRDDIKNWLDAHDVTHYTIHDNLRVTVNDSVILEDLALTRLPFEFSEVNGLLSLANNQLTTLEGIGLPHKLEELIVSGNEINSLKGCPLVERLYANDNKIESFEGLPLNCKTLSLKNNRLCSLQGIDRASQLSRLIVCGNQIKTTKGLNIPIHTLDVSQNPITELSDLPENLTILKANHCQLTSLVGIAQHVLVLSLSHNQITDLGSLKKNRFINSLNIEHNLLASLKGLPKNHFYELNASFNQISTLEGLENFPSTIQSLYLNGNPIVSLEHCPSSEELSLNNCGLTDDKLDPLLKIECKELSLKNNLLQRPFLSKKYSNLKLENNPLQAIFGVKEVEGGLYFTIHNEDELNIYKDIIFDAAYFFELDDSNVIDEKNNLSEYWYCPYVVFQQILNTTALKERFEHILSSSVLKKKHKI